MDDITARYDEMSDTLLTILSVLTKQRQIDSERVIGEVERFMQESDFDSVSSVLTSNQ